MNERNIILFPVSLEAAKLFDEAMQQEAKRLGYIISNEPESIKITARPEYIEPIVTLHQGPIGAILPKGKRKRW